jgi:hypothetical protein
VKSDDGEISHALPKLARCNRVGGAVGVKENYYLSADGYLMPAKKGQAPPDLRYFNPSKK